jgi:hypothetical protein
MLNRLLDRPWQALGARIAGGDTASSRLSHFYNFLRLRTHIRPSRPEGLDAKRRVPHFNDGSPALTGGPSFLSML